VKRTALSKKELERAEILGRVKIRTLRLADAAEILRMSYRQTKRLWRRYRQHGAEGLKHGNAGRSSNRAKPAAFRQRILQLVAQKYSGTVQERFGPTLAAEHLAEEDKLAVDAETLRRWMLAEGLWSRTRGKQRLHRRRRQRKDHFGELVQMDGSFHAWFEARGPQGCLMNMVDDATGTTSSGLGEAETIWAAVAVLRGWIEKYGVPRTLYTDWKNVYKTAPTPLQQERGETPVTHFGRMCERLGIQIIAASSPQAKGRVERNNGVQQDRLVKKLRRRGIRTYQGANRYLHVEYLAEHNRRFARPAARSQDYHRAAPSSEELDRIFRLEIERFVSNDWVVRYQGRTLQLLPPSRRYGPRESKAWLYESEDGRMEIHYRGEPVRFQEITVSHGSVKQESAPQIHVPYVRPRPQPDNNHPYKRDYENRIKRSRWKQLKRAVRARAEGSASVPPERAAQAAAPGCTPALPAATTIT
jgi:transposase